MPLRAPDRTSTATPVAGSGPMTAACTAATTVVPVASTCQSTVSSAASKIRAGTPLQSMDATPRATGRPGGLVFGTGRQRVVVAASGCHFQNDTRILKSGKQFGPSDAFDACDTQLVGELGARAHQVADARIAIVDMHDQGRGVRLQRLGHIRIQGVVGEEALRPDGQQRDLDVEEGTVERRRCRHVGWPATSAAANGQGEPAQRGQPSQGRCRHR